MSHYRHPDPVVHTVGNVEHWLDRLGLKIPRALCGASLVGDPSEPELGPDAPDCAACASRRFNAAVRREMWRRRLAHFRRDPLRRYGWDSLRRERRRERAEQDAAKARARLLRHVSMLITLVAVALVIVIWDHYAQTINLPRPVDHGVSAGATHPGDH